jgi:hypothetical protein
MEINAVLNTPSASAAVGGGIALLASLTTQLFASRQQAREREMALRREVYLPAAEAISRLQSLLFRLAAGEREEVLKEEGQAATLALARVYVVAGDRTIQALVSLSTSFQRSSFELLRARDERIELGEKP